MKLLYYLAEHSGQTFSRNELTVQVWGNRVIGDNSLSNAIHTLRAALEDNGKLQQVIKTVPKRGYLLEAEYCQVVEATMESMLTEQPESSELGQPAAYPVMQVVASKTSQGTSSEIGKRAWFKILLRTIYLAVLPGIIMLAGSWWIADYMHSTDIIYQEQGKSNYSNIRVFRILLSSDSLDEEEFYRFKDHLQRINQVLISHNAGMTVYYRTTVQILNYSFAIKTPCDDQQIAMTLYHWRVDSQKLAEIIYRETVRVLNEMAECKKKQN
ncbi:winged helix-turn-helix domain-containing protein [Citrobacter portucalensis]|uniref:winged helix-turn-helix domain-containing protein n=1 Tax=Citrobacter portucalensis TaxID=1639133 RepID=UPI003CE8C332